MKIKNYKLTSLMIDTEDWELLSQIAKDVKMRNTDLARLILNQELRRIKSLGANNYRISITGEIENGK
jgi:hypothetical protein